MRRLILIAALLVALTLGACQPRAALDPSIRPALPAVPADLATCLRRAFPEIPATAFGRATAVRLIADAKLLDRAKTACGERLLAWASDVQREFGRH